MTTVSALEQLPASAPVIQTKCFSRKVLVPFNTSHSVSQNKCLNIYWSWSATGMAALYTLASLLACLLLGLFTTILQVLFLFLSWPC